ncbi:unnamed protein product [Dicrocoelium dendriticum]|nr:unnamed protein product [Dicrocoelium dendriticum]
MSKSTFGPVICPVCNETVYFAEEIRSMGKSFHRICFKCRMCNKLLDSFTANENSGHLYCRACHLKLIRSPGNLPSFNALTFQPMNGRRSQSQPRILQNSPNGSDSSYRRNAVGEDSPTQYPSHRDIYHVNEHYESGHEPSNLNPVREQYHTRWEVPRTHGTQPPRPKWKEPSVGRALCANCSESVFANERIDAVGKSFHRLCFKCASCRRLLDRGTACDHDYQVYCQNCHIKNFGSRGFKAGTNLRCE